jgi:glycosyltransferase involved in cell wall biosynthesis
MALAAAGESPRILQVFVPGAAGGLESVVVMLALGLREAGVSVAVSAVLEPEAPIPSSVLALQESGLEVFCHAPAHRAYLRERRLHEQTIRRWDAQVVHTHGYRADLLAGSAAARSGRSRVATVHGFTGGDWKNRLYERLQLRSFRRFDAILAVSRPIRDRLRAVGIAADRIAVVPNAWSSARPSLDRAAARSALGLPPDARVIGWVGRLSQEKGADVLLDAIPLVGDPAIVVSFLGDGGERLPLEARASALGITGRVRWHGVIPDAGVYGAAFDCFVLSSRTEGTPIALLEAMAAGVPIVTTAVGGVPDIVSEAEALLVPSESPGALARAIADVFAVPEAAALRARQARERLTRAYAPGPWITRHREIYRDILARRRGENA